LIARLALATPLRRAAILSFSLFAIPTTAASSPGSTPLTDLLQVLVVDRDLVAIDDAGGGQTLEHLRLDERVVWQGSRGKLGVVLTDQRALAVATQSSAWQSIDYGRDEQPDEAAYLGERVAVIATSERILGFDGHAGNFVEYRLGLREQVSGIAVGENVAVVVTDRHAIGLSPFVGGFFRTPVALRDAIESVSAESTLATVMTEHHVLTFRASTGRWQRHKRSLR